MQAKPRYSRPMVLLMMLIGLTSGLVVVLLTRDITPPQQQVEKPLNVVAVSQ
jgi:hypothetical protein